MLVRIIIVSHLDCWETMLCEVHDAIVFVDEEHELSSVVEGWCEEGLATSCIQCVAARRGRDMYRERGGIVVGSIREEDKMQYSRRIHPICWGRIPFSTSSSHAKEWG